MGCTSAKPKPPTGGNLPNNVNIPDGTPGVPDFVQGELPKTKRSTALFSRGESQADELPSQAEVDEGATVQQRDVSNISTGSNPPSALTSEAKPRTPPPRPVTEIAAVAVVVETMTTFAVDATHEPQQQQTITFLAGTESEEVRLEDIVVSDSSDTEEATTEAIPNAPVTEAAAAPALEHAPSVSVEEKLSRVEAVIYPSAKAALSANGLQKYSAELEKRGIIEYKDLANLNEDISDPFWNRMPPFPDRKKLRGLVEDVRHTYGLSVSGDAVSTDEAAYLPEPTGAAVPQRPVEAANAEGDQAEVRLMESAAAVASAAAAAAAGSGQNQVEQTEEVSEEAPSTPPRQKTANPCNDFEVDVYAAEFGMCVCGHPRKMHESSTGLNTPSYVQKQASKRDVVATPTKKDGNVCSNYAVDLTATSFGMCVCGNPKSAHAISTAPTSNKFKEMARGSFTSKNSPVPVMPKQVSDSSIEEKSSQPPTPLQPKVTPGIDVPPIEEETLPATELEGEPAPVTVGEVESVAPTEIAVVGNLQTAVSEDSTLL